MGYSTKSIPDYFILDTEFGKYSIDVQQSGNMVRVIKSFHLNTGKYEITRYKEFYDFIHTIARVDENGHIVTQKQN
jgi:hypothetical protein